MLRLLITRQAWQCHSCAEYPAMLCVRVCRCWGGTGLDRRVLSMLMNLVDTSLDPSRLKIYFTGTACQ